MNFYLEFSAFSSRAVSFLPTSKNLYICT